jgi:hypothetical protein
MRHHARTHARWQCQRSMQRAPGPPTSTGERRSDAACSRAESRLRDTQLRHGANLAPIREQVGVQIIIGGAGGELTPERVAAYLAKYATKSAEDFGLPASARRRPTVDTEEQDGDHSTLVVGRRQFAGLSYLTGGDVAPGTGIRRPRPSPRDAPARCARPARGPARRGRRLTLRGDNCCRRSTGRARASVWPGQRCGPPGDRTRNPRIKSPLLCQLS